MKPSTFVRLASLVVLALFTATSASAQVDKGFAPPAGKTPAAEAPPAEAPPAEAPKEGDPKGKKPAAAVEDKDPFGGK